MTSFFEPTPLNEIVFTVRAHERESEKSGEAERERNAGGGRERERERERRKMVGGMQMQNRLKMQ